MIGVAEGPETKRDAGDEDHPSKRRRIGRPEERANAVLLPCPAETDRTQPPELRTHEDETTQVLLAEWISTSNDSDHITPANGKQGPVSTPPALTNAGRIPNRTSEGDVLDHGGHSDAGIQPAPARASSQEAPAGPRGGILKIRGDGKLVSPKKSTPTMKRGQTDPSSSKTASLKRTSKANSKISLQIGSDGKLSASSPDLIPEIPPVARKQRGRPRKANFEPLSRLVVVDYKNESRFSATIGQGIEEILAGQVRHKQQPDLRTKLDLPAKATHPFFLGKKAAADATCLQGTESDAQRSFQASACLEKPSPRKARVNSKPPGMSKEADKIPSNMPMFGSDHAKILRFPGACDPVWPSNEMLHVGRQNSHRHAEFKSEPAECTSSSDSRKLKAPSIRIDDSETVLWPNVEAVRAMKAFHTHGSRFSPFRRPARMVLRCGDFQQMLASRLDHRPVKPLKAGGSLDPDEKAYFATNRTHPAIVHAHASLATIRTAFDRFECENQDWARKFAPRTADQVLQSGREPLILKEWLQNLKVTSTTFKQDQSDTRRSGLASHVKRRPHKKKRKSNDELDGFIVSSEDEMTTLDEPDEPDDGSSIHINGKRTVIRQALPGDSARNTLGTGSVMLISGPHGCGKTAAVYAAAHELGFEVFEINSSSRRSGKDILEKVGDMTRNHQVRHEDRAGSMEVDHESAARVEEKLQADLVSGRQGTVNSFFKAKPKAKPTTNRNTTQSRRKVGKQDPAKMSSPDTQSKDGTLKQRQSQKQSLIFLEEVDVLFEEDRLFWSTVLDLIHASRRPIILTCSDESLVPLDDLSLQGILRLTQPPSSLVNDYLLLIAGIEGHLLNSEAIAALFSAKRGDLRATLVELQFYCQMGVGDKKGGLEWMLLDERRPDQVYEGERLRVVSEDTYVHGMGWLGGDAPSACEDLNLNEEIEMRSQLWRGWHLASPKSDSSVSRCANRLQQQCHTPQDLSLAAVDQCFSSQSAADLLPAAFQREAQGLPLDPSQPGMTDTQRANYTDRLPLIDAHLRLDPAGLADSIALTLTTLASDIMDDAPLAQTTLSCYSNIPSLIEDQTKTEEAKLVIQGAYTDLTFSLRTSNAAALSVMESPRAVVALDVAPYLRSIVSYDVRLKKQREQLASLFASGASSRLRKTRASLAALEGGDKGNTRRDNWFSDKTDADMVLQTGGEGWEMAIHQLTAERADSILGLSQEDSLASPPATSYRSDGS